MKFFQNLKRKAKELKANLLTLWFAYRDPKLPWYAKLWVGIVVGYAFSPIDLIPDFIPILGYLDDVVLLPAGIWVAIRLVPPEVWTNSHRKAHEWLAQNKGRPKNRAFAVLIVLLWLAPLFFVFYIVLRHFI